MAAMSGTGIGIASLRRQPTSVVFTVAVTLLGLGLAASAVATLAALTSVAPALHAGTSSRRQRWHLLRALSMMGGLLLVLFLLGRLRSHRTYIAPHVAGAPGQAGSSGSAPFHIVPTASFVTIGIVGALAVVLVLVPAAIRWRAPGWRSRAGAPAPLSSPWGGAGDKQPDQELARSVLAVDVADPLREPDPRRAVVAAYLQMTAAAEKAGAGRAPEETARELLGRLLGSLEVPSQPARDLTYVFERARYSFEEVQERDRKLAVDAVGQIRAELSTRLREQSPAPEQVAQVS